MVEQVATENTTAESVAGATQYRMGRKELVGLISGIMAFTAVGIDLMLPAFDDIRADFDLGTDSTQTTRVVTMYFFGLAAGQLFYGPIADRFGRKPTLYAGAAVYVVGSIGAALASSFEMLLAARFVWGLGAAGTRVVAAAIIRDRFEGAAMASALSNVMAVFLLVPVIAPSLGAVIISVLPWRSLFWFCGLFAAVIVVWSFRMRETLDPAKRRSLKPKDVGSGYLEVARTPITFGYTVSTIFIQAAFTIYLASSELIISNGFDREAQFPVIFGAVAIMFGAASLVNARIVERLGIDGVVNRTFAGLAVILPILIAITLLTSGSPNFWLFMPILSLVLGSFMFLMPNLNSAAMLPLGSIAGAGSALTGAVRVGLGAALGGVISEQVSASTTPLVIGLTTMILCCGATVWLVRQGGIRGLMGSSNPA